MRTNDIASLAKPEISQFPGEERLHMPGSPTAPGRPDACDSASVRVAFHQQNGVSTRVGVDFAAQWLAYAIPPYRRFADALTSIAARLGADVVRYTFVAVDFHLLLLAGLLAHSAFHLTGGSPGLR